VVIFGNGQIMKKILDNKALQRRNPMPEPPRKCPRKTKKLHKCEAEIALIRAGYFRLSGADKKVISGKAEALAFCPGDDAERSGRRGWRKKGYVRISTAEQLRVNRFLYTAGVQGRQFSGHKMQRSVSKWI
jgi:hypothetical protein